MFQSAANHPAIDDPNAFVLYRYIPNTCAALIFIICFSLSTGLHVSQAVNYRSLFFVPFIVGGFFQCIGYLARALAHDSQYDLAIFLTQILLLLVAPALFAATIYMILGRLIALTDGEAFAPVPARQLTRVFVCGDAISFIVQAGGGGLMSDFKLMNFGKHLVVAGLLLQIVFFGIFIAMGSIFHFRITRSPTPASTYHSWQPYMYILYVASTLILIRSVFRVIEFSGGNDGILLRKELFLYVFDAFLMLGVMGAFNLLHPGQVLGKRTSGSGIRMGNRSGSDDSRTSERKARAINRSGCL